MYAIFKILQTFDIILEQMLFFQGALLSHITATNA